MKGPFTHYNKVPIVEPAQSMDHRDISNTVESTDAFSVTYQQLVACQCVRFWGAFANLRKMTINLMSVCPSVCLSVCPSVCLSVRLYVRLSACLSVCLSVRLSVCPSVCLSVCLSVRLSVCPSVSVHPTRTTRLPLEEFSRNLILEWFSKNPSIKCNFN
jgi:hypothetical protein